MADPIDTALYGPHQRVADMPRRMAHALFALLEASAESGMPPTAREVVIYDSEAFSARQTAAALREAARRGYCACAGGYWVPGNRAYELRTALEKRYLRETDTSEGDHEY